MFHLCMCECVCVHSFLCVWIDYVVWEEEGFIQIIHLTKGVNFIHMWVVVWGWSYYCYGGKGSVEVYVLGVELIFVSGGV